MIRKTGLALLILFLLCTLDGHSAPELKPELHRLDFRIEGRSCPACLRSIQDKLKSFSGVQDAVVMVSYPFTASVIYHAEDASADYILNMIKVKEPGIVTVDVNDSKIDEMPQPFLPPAKPVPSNNNALYIAPTSISLYRHRLRPSPQDTDGRWRWLGSSWPSLKERTARSCVS